MYCTYLVSTVYDKFLGIVITIIFIIKGRIDANLDYNWEISQCQFFSIDVGGCKFFSKEFIGNFSKMA